MKTMKSVTSELYEQVGVNAPVHCEYAICGEPLVTYPFLYMS